MYKDYVYGNKNKEHYLKSKDKAKKWYDVSKQIQYGPVTMIPPSGHQVRCLPWVQMGTLNKEIGFYVD